MRPRRYGPTHIQAGATAIRALETLVASSVCEDEVVPRDLERSGGRAQARGGVAAAGAWLERTTALTADPVRRAAHALAAARAEFDAGTPDTAFELLASARTKTWHRDWSLGN